MSQESIKVPYTINNSFDPEIIHSYGQERVKFKGICLKKRSIYTR